MIVGWLFGFNWLTVFGQITPRRTSKIFKASLLSYYDKNPSKIHNMGAKNSGAFINWPLTLLHRAQCRRHVLDRWSGTSLIPQMLRGARTLSLKPLLPGIPSPTGQLFPRSDGAGDKLSATVWGDTCKSVTAPGVPSRRRQCGGNLPNSELLVLNRLWGLDGRARSSSTLPPTAVKGSEIYSKSTTKYWLRNLYK